jgi:hypothetical protein
MHFHLLTFALAAPIVLWVGFALVLRTIEPQTKVGRVQSAALCAFAFLFLPAWAALAVLAQKSAHPLAFATLGLLEALAVCGAVLVQVRRLAKHGPSKLTHAR